MFKKKKKIGTSKSAKITRRLRNLILRGVSQLQHAYAFCSGLLFFNVITIHWLSLQLAVVSLYAVVSSHSAVQCWAICWVRCPNVFGPCSK